MRKKELNFLALVSIVIGSQIGSGAFVLPSVLAPFKTIGLLGWFISVAGAISLALVFSDLASHLPKNGGPHVYVGEAFGRTYSFFTAWIYWIISWASSSVLIVTAMNYLTAIAGKFSHFTTLCIEIFTLWLVTYINTLGMKVSGKIETVLTILKVIPLIFLPIVFFCFFDPSNFNFSMKEIASETDILTVISKTALLTFWGFIGVECATAPAESVHNPSKNIPRAIILGTICVALIYILNTVSIMGAIGFDSLMNTNAPYAIAMSSIFPKNSEIVISVMAIIVCIGTLNAWTLTSGQIAYGAVTDGLFPKIFSKSNKAGAPVVSLWIAAVGMVPFLFLEEMDYWRNGLERLLDLLVSIFIFVYLLCCISYTRLICKWYKTKKERIKKYLLTQIAVVFCIFVLYQDLLASFLVLAIFILLGFPIFWKHRANIKSNNCKL